MARDFLPPIVRIRLRMRNRILGMGSFDSVAAALRGTRKRMPRTCPTAPYATDTVCTCRTRSYTRIYSRAEALQEKSFIMPLRISVCHVLWSRKA
jgi:hypothetical protein